MPKESKKKMEHVSGDTGGFFLGFLCGERTSPLRGGNNNPGF